jgi:hypothetical protein
MISKQSKSSLNCGLFYVKNNTNSGVVLGVVSGVVVSGVVASGVVVSGVVASGVVASGVVARR